MPEWLKLDAGLVHAWYRRSSCIRRSSCGLEEAVERLFKAKKRDRHCERCVKTEKRLGNQLTGDAR